jgi:hypothetical protein
VTAAEVLALHQINEWAQHDGWWGCKCDGDVECNPQHQLDELLAAGHAVVELPKPVASNRYGQKWATGFRSVWTLTGPGDQGVLVGGIGPQPPEVARRLAAAILAAAADVGPLDEYREQ